jgi:hypothetical protein
MELSQRQPSAERAILSACRFIRCSASLCSSLQSLTGIVTAGLYGAGFSMRPVGPVGSGLYFSMTNDVSCPSVHVTLVEMVDGVVAGTYKMTLMAATDWSFMLADTWFLDDVIYVLGFGAPACVFIGFGAQIYTEEEAAMNRELMAFGAWLRSAGRVGCLLPAVVPAQEFAADRFTVGFCECAFRHLQETLLLPELGLDDACKKVDGDSTHIAVDK